MQVVYAKQPFPESWTSAIFLAGPTPRDKETPSWRPEAIRLLEGMGYDGVVFSPEVEDGEWKSGPDAYIEQVEWERKGLDMADQIVFWVPREMTSMPALTTNVEFGRYVTSGKVVLGAPEWAKSVKYLDTMLQTETGTKMQVDLSVVLRLAMDNIERNGATEDLQVRAGGERCVPLHIWSTPSFRQWYQMQVDAGNRLDDAKLLWHFKPGKAKVVFSWVLWVKVWIANENRWKENEYVFARPDISTVCLYHTPNKASLVPADTEVVLVREFRSPARTMDGCVHEIAGGSSFKPNQDPLKVASDEVHEETGLIIDPSRFRFIRSRQLVATLSSHHAHLFAAELTADEMAQAKTLAASQAVNGVEEDTEHTYIEVRTISEMFDDSLVDWAMLGMIMQALLGAE